MSYRGSDAGAVAGWIVIGLASAVATGAAVIVAWLIRVVMR